MSVKVGSKVNFHYQHEGKGIHGFGVVIEKIILPKLIKYNIEDSFGKIHSCYNAEVSKIKSLKGIT